MAKIIDFKTRNVLADLPFKTTPRMVKGWHRDNSYAIAMTQTLAVALLDKQIKAEPKAS